MRSQIQQRLVRLLVNMIALAPGGEDEHSPVLLSTCSSWHTWTEPCSQQQQQGQLLKGLVAKVQDNQRASQTQQ